MVYKTKFGDAKQAKPTHQFKNFKIKLHKTNAAIWYNKMCRLKPPITSTLK